MLDEFNAEIEEMPKQIIKTKKTNKLTGFKKS